MKTAMHYSGGVEWFDARGGSTRMLPGYAACCTGDRAYVIRRLKRQTTDEREVTCKGCLRALAREQSTLNGVVAKVRAALVERVGAAAAERLTVCRGGFAKPDLDDPPHLAYVTTEARELASDPKNGTQWVEGGDTILRAMEALLKLVAEMSAPVATRPAEYDGGAVCTRCNGARVVDGDACVCAGGAL